MEVTTTPQKLGNTGFLILNVGPDALYVGESTVDEDTGVKLLAGQGVSVGGTAWDVYVVSEGDSTVVTLAEGMGMFSPPAEAEEVDLSAYVAKAAYDANTMLVAHTDNTPVAVAIETNKVVGRGNSGNVKGLSPTEVVTIIGTEVFTQPQTVNPQTGTTYTLVAGDSGKLISLSNAAAITLTVPQDTDATIAIGTYLDLYQLGAGQVTVQAGTGATLRVSGLTAKARAQYSRLGLQKVSANTWSLFGDLAAS